MNHSIHKALIIQSVWPIYLEQFVEQLDLTKLGFRNDFIENDSPAYRPLVLLKLYIYGYMNRVRSSRQLEKECKRNIEVMWLL